MDYLQYEEKIRAAQAAAFKRLLGALGDSAEPYVSAIVAQHGPVGSATFRPPENWPERHTFLRVGTVAYQVTILDKGYAVRVSCPSLARPWRSDSGARFVHRHEGVTIGRHVSEDAMRRKILAFVLVAYDRALRHQEQTRRDDETRLQAARDLTELGFADDGTLTIAGLAFRVKCFEGRVDLETAPRPGPKELRPFLETLREAGVQVEISCTPKDETGGG